MRGAVHQHLRHFGSTNGDTLLLATRLGQLLNIPSPVDLQQGTQSVSVEFSLLVQRLRLNAEQVEKMEELLISLWTP